MNRKIIFDSTLNFKDKQKTINGSVIISHGDDQNLAKLQVSFQGLKITTKNHMSKWEVLSSKLCGGNATIFVSIKKLKICIKTRNGTCKFKIKSIHAVKATSNIMVTDLSTSVNRCNEFEFNTQGNKEQPINEGFRDFETKANASCISEFIHFRLRRINPKRFSLITSNIILNIKKKFQNRHLSV